MKKLLKWIIAKSQVKYEESEGIGLAVQTVGKLRDRTFRVKGPGMKYSDVPAEEVVRFIREELPGYYNYYIRVKNYLDRQEMSQAEIEITGVIGMRGKSSRYNPLDRKFVITSKKRKSDDKLTS